MTPSGDSNLRPANLPAVLKSAEGSLNFLGRRWEAAALDSESKALAAGFRRLGLQSDDAVALLLPNVPLVFTAIFACARAGLRALLLDPRVEEGELAGRLTVCRPKLLLTQNPAPLFDRAVRLLPHCPSSTPVVVQNFTDLLPFPRNILAPLLRGGGLASIPPDPRFLAYRALLAYNSEGKPVESTAPPLDFLHETMPSSSLMADITGHEARRLKKERLLVAGPLADPSLLKAALSAFYRGAELLLSPRLDDDSLNKIERQARPDRRLQ